VLPKRWEDVTPEWMTAALAIHHPHAVVGEVTVLLRDDGTNRRARLGLTYAAGAGPATVFVKAHDPARRLVHLRNGNLFGEARLFKTGVDLGVEHPIVYKAVVDRRRLDFLLMRTSSPAAPTREMRLVRSRPIRPRTASAASLTCIDATGATAARRSPTCAGSRRGSRRRAGRSA
jgi:hypothetical protein